MSNSNEKQAEALLQKASDWWQTAIIDIEPGVIRPRGKPIQDLIGTISFPQIIWLMLRGELPPPAEAKLLEAALVAAVDHGPHAPSIAIARMAVTCGLPLNGAMASGINSLDDIHGGAGEQCLELYQKAVNYLSDKPLEQAVDAALNEHIAENGKIVPGFGHRFHPVDPRAVRLLELVDQAKSDNVVRGDFAAVGKQIESALKLRTGKSLPMNIDGVTAVIYGELGFPAPLARGLFILSRSVGILAHSWEQMEENHRIKGPMPKEIPYTYTGPRE